MADLAAEVKKRVQDGEPVYRIRLDLLKHGYLEGDVEEAIHSTLIERRSAESVKEQRNSNKVMLKEILDRIGFGFGSQQFINIIFYIMQAPLFLIVVLNGIRGLLTMTISSFLHEHSKSMAIRKRAIVWSGLIFSISFVGISAAIFLNSYTFFAVTVLVNAVFLVFYGDFYYNIILSAIRLERAGHFLKRMSEYGLLITAAALLLGGYLLNAFRETGYIIIMLVAAVPFMLSIVTLYFISATPHAAGTAALSSILKDYFRTAREDIPLFMRNSTILILILTGSITSIVQTLGNAFYGIYIYQYLYSEGFTGFLNVAVIFVIALVASLLGSTIIRKTTTNIGKFPLLVFGTLLVAITPLTFYFNPNFTAISIAITIGILGSSMLGTARGLLAIDLLPEDKRKSYYALSGFLFFIPYLLMTALFAYVIQMYQFKLFFLLLALTLALFVTPLYLFILIINHKVRKI